MATKQDYDSTTTRNDDDNARGRDATRHDATTMM